MIERNNDRVIDRKSDVSPSVSHHSALKRKKRLNKTFFYPTPGWDSQQLLMKCNQYLSFLSEARQSTGLYELLRSQCRPDDGAPRSLGSIMYTASILQLPLCLQCSIALEYCRVYKRQTTKTFKDEEDLSRQ